MSETKTLSELARELYQAKQAESAAKEQRIAVEEQIAAQVTIDGDRGSKTVDAGDGLKITVKRELNYKADVDAIRALDLPSECYPVKHVPDSWAFDKISYEKIIAANPAVAQSLASCITVTPAKVSVTLKL